VSGLWDSLIPGNPLGIDIEFPISFSEDSRGNLYVVSFGNSPTDSLNGGTVRGVAGLGIGEIYELTAVPEPATFVLLIIAAAGWCLLRSRAA
jgi:hypothetical protein